MSVLTQDRAPSIPAIVARYPANRGSLIPILQDIQAAQGYLSETAVTELEGLLDISANEIFGVATFYTQFRFVPPAKHTIQVCQGTACHVRGGKAVLDEFERRLNIVAGESTEDGQFALERVACLGCCALAPVVAVDGTVHAEVSPKRVPKILAQYK
ncbi:MAG: NADH-quinone oxidoreductase subunit NuoE [Candidatus Hydrogenedentota bacterium]